MSNWQIVRVFHMLLRRGDTGMTFIAVTLSIELDLVLKIAFFYYFILVPFVLEQRKHTTEQVVQSFGTKMNRIWAAILLTRKTTTAVNFMM